MEHEYIAAKIQIFTSLEAIRFRPNMYIGSIPTTGVHKLIYEFSRYYMQ